MTGENQSEVVLSSRVGVAKFGKKSNGTRENKGECRVKGRP